MVRGFLIIAGAFLAFVVQPMVTKALLPGFGGAASVWTTVLLFFQCTLVLGYVYARWAVRRLHIAVLLAALVGSGYPIASGYRSNPDWEVVLVLAASVGAPFAVLAATSPLWQRWSGSPAPYRLYALSNAASLVALLGYPGLIEPWLDVETQLKAWRAAFAVFAAVSIFAAARVPKEQARVRGWAWDWWWPVLSACGTLLLGATSNQLSQEVASVPFLWVVPLALYLISFIVVFDRPQWYNLDGLAWMASLLIPVCCVLVVVGMRAPFLVHLGAYSLMLFVGLWICHGELARRRPSAEASGAYYIALAVGGALGGLLVAIVAPRVFTTYAEFPLALAGVASIAMWGLYSRHGFSAAAAGLLLAIITPVIVTVPSAGGARVLEAKRSFYGVLRVTERDGVRKLEHGATTHGTQFLDAARRQAPTTYYGPGSGAFQAVAQQSERLQRPLRIGVIGLGAGTMAAQQTPGTVLRFYELNAQVEELARRHFTYLADSKAQVEVVLGDARLRLAAEPRGNFDVLVLDAFSSDAIPIHLLTREAAAIYKRHLAADGVLAVHISNLTVDLEPVVRGMVRSIGYQAERMDRGKDDALGVEASSWMIARPGAAPASGRELQWSDRHASLWPVLR